MAKMGKIEIGLSLRKVKIIGGNHENKEGWFSHYTKDFAVIELPNGKVVSVYVGFIQFEVPYREIKYTCGEVSPCQL